MSLLFLDSFDHYDDLALKWDSQFFGSNILPVQTQGRFTPGAVEIRGAGGGGHWTKSIVESEEVIVGFAYLNLNADSWDASFRIGTASDVGAASFAIDFGTGVGTLTMNGNVATTPSTEFSGGIWEWIELRVKIHSSLGELEIRHNGTSVAGLTGVNTRGALVGDFESVSIYATNNGQLHYIDDLHVMNTLGTSNNTFAGDSRITVLRPKANGVSNNFTPSAGTNFETQDEILCDYDVSYVEGGQYGASEDYNQKSFDDIGVVPSTIYGVQVVNAAKKTDAGRLDYIDEMVIAGNRYSTGVSVISTSGAYKMTTYIRDTDPSDDAAWTEDKIEAVGSGFSITYREV